MGGATWRRARASSHRAGPGREENRGNGAASSLRRASVVVVQQSTEPVLTDWRIHELAAVTGAFTRRSGSGGEDLLGAEISSSERRAIDHDAVAMVQAAENRCSGYEQAQRRLRWRQPFLTSGRLQTETAMGPPVVVMRVLAQQPLGLMVVPDEQ